jgi:hypothetical protein
VTVDQFIDDDARVRRIRFKLYPKILALELLASTINFMSSSTNHLPTW